MFGSLFEKVFRLDENEKVIRTIYKIYKDEEKGFEPEVDDLDVALEGMEEYYSEYLDWWKKGYGKREPAKLKRDYNKRYNEIVHALQSDSLKDKIIALDNAINQWHIDYPALVHLQMDAEEEAEEEDITELSDIIDDIEEILRRLGRLSEESPYVRR